MTATQDQQLGYALDSRWYGIGEFTAYMRGRLAKLTPITCGPNGQKPLTRVELHRLIRSRREPQQGSPRRPH
jgi:hypothetical protein